VNRSKFTEKQAWNGTLRELTSYQIGLQVPPGMRNVPSLCQGDIQILDMGRAEKMDWRAAEGVVFREKASRFSELPQRELCEEKEMGYASRSFGQKQPIGVPHAASPAASVRIMGLLQELCLALLLESR
jgi:hypothetical protein